MTKTYKDQQGNKYRKGTGGWEILRKGIGWQAFESTAYVNVKVYAYGDGEGATETLTIPPTPQTEPPEVAEEKQVRKVRENELFVHIAVEQMKQLTIILPSDSSDAAMKKLGFSSGETDKFVSTVSCDYAQAMIDELKERGRL